jgi:ABC-type multidrug transport system ATPase subunit
MGPSGAGKTTIINLVTGKVEKTDGVIRINQEEVFSP